MSSPSPKPGNYYVSSPYSSAFDIEYPQENLEGEMYKYRCKYCKKLTTDINGRVENHAPDCEYRLQKGGRST
jgi:DNA-directed RNA polymerase subunit RPC12/RpoP